MPGSQKPRKVIYRRNPGEAETKKQKTPVPIADPLLAHLRRWKRHSNALYVVTWDGARMAEIRRAFESAVRLAGLDDLVTPHTLRHTCATWLMQNGVEM